MEVNKTHTQNQIWWWGQGIAKAPGANQRGLYGQSYNNLTKKNSIGLQPKVQNKYS